MSEPDPTTKRTARRALLKYALLAFVLVGGCNTDLVTKQLATERLEGGEKVEVVSGFLDLRYTENDASAFSLLSSVDPDIRFPILVAGPLLTSLIVAVLLVIKRRRAARELLPFALILAGGLGNLIDRLRFGHVVDFIHFHVRDSFSWPIFNVADVLIVIGIGLLLLQTMRAGGRATPVGAGT